MPYCIYLRKSRKDTEAELRGEGETLARHQAALLEHAKHLKIEIDAMYKEVVSGDTIAARPVMQKLLSEVQQGVWDGVLVMEVERLARGDTVDQGIVAQSFKWSGTKIITPMKTYDPNNEFDEEYFEFGLFMSRREYKTINRRLQQGRAASAKEGKFVGSIAPFGYERVKIANDKGYTLKIVPEQAEIVRLIFEWYTVGHKNENGEVERLGLQKLARTMNELGIPPIRNDYWMKETLKDIITNPTYAGKIRWGFRKVKKTMKDGIATKSRPINDENCILVEGLHEAIVSEETFNLAQKILSQNPASPVGCKKEVKSPLAGIVVCSKCGRRMVYRAASTEKKRPYLVCHARACANVSAPYELVEHRVLQSLQDLLDEYELEQQTKSKSGSEKYIKEQKALLSKNQTETDKLKKQLSKAQDFLEQEVYSVKEYSERSKIIKDKISSLDEARQIFEDNINKAEDLQKKKLAIIPKIRHVLSTYDTLPTAKAKNELLKQTVEKAVYNKDIHGSFKGASADDFDLALFLKLE